MDTDTQKQKCTNCKCNRPLDWFIGKKGNPVVQCSTCRDKDARKKSKPEVKEKTKLRNREKQYYKDYRKRKLEEDPDSFRAHNNQLARERREKKMEEDKLAKN
jgi:hypothetical protein